MDWHRQLITLYLQIDSFYHHDLWILSERFSPNASPSFSDVEAMTVYLWGVGSGYTQLKRIHEFTSRYLSSWFPTLPSYGAFVNRINRQGDALCGLFHHLLACIDYREATSLGRLIDSFLVILAKRQNSYKAKVAKDLANQNWHPVKEMYYHGVKIHSIAWSRFHQLPLLEGVWITPASTHDLEAFRQVKDELMDAPLLADKAYGDSELQKEFQEQGGQLLASEKRTRNSPSLLVTQRAKNSLIAKNRQPIEGLFQWIQQQTSIEDASKVRSSKGLIVHLWGKLSTALMKFLNIF